MADRTTKVTLIAQVAGYVEGMERAAAATRKTGTEAEKLAAQRQAFQQLGAGMVAFGAVAAAGLAIAIKKYADFDQAMSGVNSILQETPENFDKLKNAALDAGAVTVFTARESANAIEELGKAGITTADILGGGLTGALSLASAGELEVARAAEITGITLKQFNLAGSEAGRVADVLAAGANKAVGSVDDLAAGLKFVGPVASSMNVSLEDTAATLALFADRGVIGEQAGSSLRGVLSSLTSPSKAAKAELDKLNVTLYDGQGQFLGLENVAGQLQTALKGTDDATRDMALGTLFGNQQITAARILVDAGAEGWRDYRDAVEDAGIAGRIAEQRLDNLAGDVEKLGGAFDTAFIKTGAAANDTLRFMTQFATDAVDAYSDLPAGAQTAVFWVGAVTAAVALGGGTFLIAVPKVAAYRTAIATLGTTAQTTSRVLGGVFKGAGIAAGVAVAVGLADQLAESFRKVEIRAKEMVNALATDGDELEHLGAALDQVAKSADNSWAGIFASTIDSATFQAGATETRKYIAGLGDELAALPVDELATRFTQLRTKVELTDTQLISLIRTSPALNAALTDAATNAGVAATDQNLLNLAFEATRPAAEKAATSTEIAAESLENLSVASAEAASLFIDLGGAYDVVVQKNQDYAQSTADATESSTDSWEDYYDGFSVAVGAYLDELQRQVDAQNNWEQNMTALVGRLSSTTLEELARLGPEGAPLVQALTTASDEELARLEALFAEKSQQSVSAFTNALGGAQSAIDGFIAGNDNRIIRIGVRTYGSVGEALGFSIPNERGGMYESGVRAFATGGQSFPSGIYAGRPGGIHKFAEESLPWETYISPKPGYERENIGYALESLQRLGFQFPEPSVVQVDRGPLVGQIVTGRGRDELDELMSILEFAGHARGARS